MSTVSLDGVREDGLVTIDGKIPGSTLPPISSDDVSNASDVPGANVTDALNVLSFSGPDLILTGSAAFTAGVWQSVGIYSPVEGETGGISILNGLLWRGLAATLTSSQVALRQSYRRPTGSPPIVTLGAAGIQGSIAVTQFRGVVSGNDISFEANFGVTDTITWRIPILIEKELL